MLFRGILTLLTKIKNYQVPEKRKQMQPKQGKIKMSQSGTWQYQKHFYLVHFPTFFCIITKFFFS
jgi:hypothetical protein